MPGVGLISAARRRSVASAPNPAFGNVLLLCGFNGTDGATTTTDEAIGHTFTAMRGNAQLDTAIKKFGTASLLLDGSGDCAEFADSGDWDLGGTSQPFQFEAWIRFAASANLTLSHTIISQYNASGSARAWRFYYSNGLLLFDYSGDGGTPMTTMVSASWSPSTDTWYHVATSRVSDQARLFIEGSKAAQNTNSGNPFNSSAPLRIGGVESSGAIANAFNGWIDEARYCKDVLGDGGTGFYTTDFTPPTAAFPRS